MNLNRAMKSSASGLFAERTRMDTISANIANASSMRTKDKEAYRRHMVILTGTDKGVNVTKIVEDQSPLRAVSDPQNPLADASGNVYYSNVEPITEMVNLMSATRSYEANVQAFNSAKSMVRSALSIGKV